MPEAQSVLSKLLEKATTEEMMKKIQDIGYCYLQLIPMSHLIMFVAPGNTGKTAFAIHASAAMAKAGFQVVYINADASAPDMKFYHTHASENGYTLIAPDLSNLSSDDIVKHLEQLGRSNEDLNNLVIVIDTIKKFVDVIQKSKAKEFLKTLRSLTAKGVTVIGLGHTNKNQDSGGKLSYEGTGDIRNDVDELYYMESEKIEGALKVTTYADKCRAEVKDITFTIKGKDRVIELVDYEDTRLRKAITEQRRKDQPIISFISESLKSKSASPTELEALAKESNQPFTRRSIDKVLRAYALSSEPLWSSTQAPKNGLIYSINGNISAPPQNSKVCKV